MPTITGGIKFEKGKPIPQEVLSGVKLPFKADGFKSSCNASLVEPAGIVKPKPVPEPKPEAEIKDPVLAKPTPVKESIKEQPAYKPEKRRKK